MSDNKKVFFIASSGVGRITDRRWEGNCWKGEWFQLREREEKIIGPEFTLFHLDTRLTFPLKRGFREKGSDEINTLLVPSSSPVARHLHDTTFGPARPGKAVLNKLTLVENSAEILEKFHNYEAYWGMGGEVNSLLIKDLSKVKIEKVEPAISTITFKPRKELKKIVDRSGDGTGRMWETYYYNLEIEKLDLGVEDLPKIVLLKFFVGKRNVSYDTIGSTNSEKFEREGYRQLLQSRVGEEFTMEVRKWNFSEGEENKYGKSFSPNQKYESLDFTDDDSFGQIIEGSEIKEQAETPPTTGPNNLDDPNPADKQTPQPSPGNPHPDPQDKDAILNVLKEIKRVIQISPNPDLKSKKEAMEKNLRQINQEALREFIKEEIQDILNQNGLELSELSPAKKKKLADIDNDDNEQTTRDEIVQAIGQIALTKLIQQLQSALRTKDQTKINTKLKELQEFVNSQLDYRVAAVADRKREIDQLFQAANNQSNSDSSFLRPDNPFLWISGISFLGLVIAVALVIVRSRREKNKSR